MCPTRLPTVAGARCWQAVSIHGLSEDVTLLRVGSQGLPVRAAWIASMGALLSWWMTGPGRVGRGVVVLLVCQRRGLALRGFGFPRHFAEDGCCGEGGVLNASAYEPHCAGRRP
jgi:hypothetical protein